MLSRGYITIKQKKRFQKYCMNFLCVVLMYVTVSRLFSTMFYATTFAYGVLRHFATQLSRFWRLEPITCKMKQLHKCFKTFGTVTRFQGKSWLYVKQNAKKNLHSIFFCKYFEIRFNNSSNKVILYTAPESKKVTRRCSLIEQMCFSSFF